MERSRNRLEELLREKNNFSASRNEQNRLEELLLPQKSYFQPRTTSPNPEEVHLRGKSFSQTGTSSPDRFRLRTDHSVAVPDFFCAAIASIILTAISAMNAGFRLSALSFQLFLLRWRRRPCLRLFALAVTLWQLAGFWRRYFFCHAELVEASLPFHTLFVRDYYVYILASKPNAALAA